MNRMQPVLLPCDCNKTVNVTGRKSKMQERPRLHQCPECGKVFRIGGDYKPQEIKFPVLFK